MSKEQRKKYIAAIFEALAATSAIATLVAFAFDVKFEVCCGIILLLLIGLICYIYAEYQTWQRKSVTIDVEQHLKLTISEGDLFAQEGIILIPVNEYFDVHVGDGIIAPGSIHGIFIRKYFSGKEQELKQLIQDYLSEYCQDKKVGDVEGRGPLCNSGKYQLGTCVDIAIDGKTYVLFALTHFNEKNKASVGRYELHKVIQSTMNHVSEICESHPVSMPLFGTGLSRIQRSPQRILHFIIDCIDFECSDKEIPGGLNIKILSLDDTKVNLNDIANIFEERG